MPKAKGSGRSGWFTKSKPPTTNKRVVKTKQSLIEEASLRQSQTLTDPYAKKYSKAEQALIATQKLSSKDNLAKCRITLQAIETALTKNFPEASRSDNIANLRMIHDNLVLSFETLSKRITQGSTTLFAELQVLMRQIDVLTMMTNSMILLAKTDDATKQQAFANLFTELKSRVNALGAANAQPSAGFSISMFSALGLEVNILALKFDYIRAGLPLDKLEKLLSDTTHFTQKIASDATEAIKSKAYADNSTEFRALQSRLKQLRDMATSSTHMPKAPPYSKTPTFVEIPIDRDASTKLSTEETGSTKSPTPPPPHPRRSRGNPFKRKKRI